MEQNKLMSKLDAVNTMLLNIGEDVVNNLKEEQDADVAAAIKTLDRVSRSVQNKGWRFNSEEDYPLSLGIGGKIKLPSNVLRAEASAKNSGVDIVQRGDRLYDRKNRTYSFNKTIYIDVVFFLPFEELPSSARDYITARASREFMSDGAPDEGNYQTVSKEEASARVIFEREEAKKAKLSIIKNKIWKGGL